jgi:hypothetical protein
MASIIQKVDDLDYAEGRQVEATVTRRVAFGDEAVTLDLTAEHDAELAKLLAPYLAAGRPQRGSTRAATRGQGATSVRRSRRELKALRAWATGNGLSWRTPGGSTYYSAELLGQWDEHKAATGWAES